MGADSLKCYRNAEQDYYTIQHIVTTDSEIGWNSAISRITHASSLIVQNFDINSSDDTDFHDAPSGIF